MDTLQRSLTLPSRFETVESWRTETPQLWPLKTRYLTKPITMHKTYQTPRPVLFPRVIRQAYAQIWSEKYSRVIIKAPRGGGKSELLGTLGFDYWYLKNRSVVNMGGSFVQAEIVYHYFQGYCDIDASVKSSISGHMTMDETKGSAGNKFSCVTASEKSVRGKHVDILMSDETCETDDKSAVI